MPADTTFKTRPEQVIEMIDAARAAGVPFSWFTADEEFGENPGLREHLQNSRISYVMAVPKNTLHTDTVTGQEIQLQHLAVTGPQRVGTSRLRHRQQRTPNL